VIAVNEPAIRQWVLGTPWWMVENAVRAAAKRKGRSPMRALNVATKALGNPGQKLTYYRGCGAVTLRILEAAMVPVGPPAFRPSLEDCVYWTAIVGFTADMWANRRDAQDALLAMVTWDFGALHYAMLCSIRRANTLRSVPIQRDECLVLWWLCRQARALVDAELVRREVPRG
jgi:hypothetical protein